jgi:hypothetical protein
MKPTGAAERQGLAAQVLTFVALGWSAYNVMIGWIPTVT